MNQIEVFENIYLLTLTYPCQTHCYNDMFIKLWKPTIQNNRLRCQP